MTGPSPAPTAGPAPAATKTAPQATGLGQDTLKALGAALAAENAAVWSYGVVAAYLKDTADLMAAIASGHLSRRDATSTLITQNGGKPITPSAAYALPVQVKDATTARQLATVLETDCAKAWRSVVGNTDRSDLRGYALAGLSDSAVWLTEIKQDGKVNPATVPFPGQPS